MHGCMSFAVATGCRVGESRRRSRTLRTGCPEGAFVGRPSFWFHLSWTSKKDELGREADETLCFVSATRMKRPLLPRRPSLIRPAGTFSRREKEPEALSPLDVGSGRNRSFAVLSMTNNSRASPANSQRLHQQRRLPNPHRQRLPLLPANPHSLIKRKIIADHRNPLHRLRPVAD
jgi:hypothetical protein